MYDFIPKEPIKDKKFICNYIAGEIDRVLKEDVDNYNITYSDYLGLYQTLLYATDDKLYKCYEEFIYGYKSREVTSFIKKSVNASYNGGIFGLSSEQKKIFMSDLRKALSKLNPNT